ncbi:hypothetical protein WMF18_12160 [Sorangium sp. So ce315]
MPTADRNVGRFADRNVGRFADRNVGRFADRNVGRFAVRVPTATWVSGFVASGLLPPVPTRASLSAIERHAVDLPVADRRVWRPSGPRGGAVADVSAEELGRHFPAHLARRHGHLLGDRRVVANQVNGQIDA